MFNRQKVPKRRELESGQSFIEMALSFVFFLFFVMGMLDLGRLYFQFVALEDAAGEAALYLALNAQCPYEPGHANCSAFLSTLPADLQPDPATACPADCVYPNNAWARADEASSLINLNDVDAAMTMEFFDATADSEAMVTIKLDYPFKLLTPVISDIVGSNTVMLSAEASQVVLAQ